VSNAPSEGGKVFERYVAIGDSSTEGLDDPDGRGGYHGWANRLAELIAAAQRVPLLYANLAVRGLSTRRIREQQLERAVAMRPDLVTLFSGTNDVVAWRFNAEAVARDAEHMQRTLIAGGATVVGFTLPDLSRVLPLARPIAHRVRALNEALRGAAAASGAILVDFALHSVGTDPRIWSADRLHANAAGHARIAAALAWALGLPGTDQSWSDPLPSGPQRSWRATVAEELRWGGRYFLPWAWRQLRGRSSGDGRGAKRPELTPVQIREEGRGKREEDKPCPDGPETPRPACQG
jgi:lysophospholipase L1-like esterase